MGSERFMDSPPSQQALLHALYAPLEGCENCLPHTLSGSSDEVLEVPAVGAHNVVR
jgi:hypothetical protein